MKNSPKTAVNVIVFIILALSATGFSAIGIPKLEGRVNDYAGMLSPHLKDTLERDLAELEKTDSTQIVILTISSLKGETLEDFSIKVADKWKIGQQGLDNGVLLLIVKNDRLIRIEVGYGLEGTLTDLISGRIIDTVITPRFRDGNFDEGVLKGIEAITSVVRGEFDAIQTKDKRSLSDAKGEILGLLIILVLVIVVLATSEKDKVSDGSSFSFGGYNSDGSYLSGGFGSGGGYSSDGFSGGGGSFGGGGASGKW